MDIMDTRSQKEITVIRKKPQPLSRIFLDCSLFLLCVFSLPLLLLVLSLPLFVGT